MTEPDNLEAESGLFTAIVHFHGMGSQRRLEETSRMIDALDRFQFTEHKAGRGLGLLRGIQPRLTPNETQGNEPHAYIRASLVGPDDAPSRDVRFYEAYWAPVMADEKSALSIALWVAGQWRRPFQNLLTPWRQRQRLRRASLIDQFEHFRSSVPTNVDTDLASLIDLYDDFESPQARRGIFNGRGPSNGSFSDFLAYIDLKNPPKNERSERGRAKRLKGVAKAWRRHYVLSELQVMFLLTTVILAVALAVAAVLIGAFGVANALLSFTSASPSLARYVPLLGEGSTIALLLATGVTSLVGITGFLTDALGDVRAWASYRETDLGNRKRQEILASARETLSRVLSDPKCARAVITAHSLGTTIAHDTLLSLTRINRAENSENPIEGPLPLRKIEHFVTWGSPIDKVEYFFESSTSTSHRYLRVQEILRGDTGGPPFAHNRKPHIHWINFWDDGDVVSGPLSSPMPAERSINPIDNFHVKGFAFPAPGASHTQYLSQRAVVSNLWDIIFNRGRSFLTLENRGEDGKLGKDYPSVLVRPGQARGERRWAQLVALALPWCLLTTLVLFLFAGVTPVFGLSLFFAASILLGIAAALSVIKGPLGAF